MTISRPKYVWVARTLRLSALAAVVSCAAEPLDVDTNHDEERVQLGTSSLEHRNFDAREVYNAHASLGDRKVTPRLVGRLAAPDVAATFDEATGATRTLQSRTGFLTAARSGSAPSIALDFARANTDALGLVDADLAGMEVTDVVYSGVTGTTHIYYRQRHLGLPVYNAQLQFNVHRDGRILSINNAFVPNIGVVARSTAPALSAAEAVEHAAANLSVGLTTRLQARSAATAGVEQRTLVDAPELSRAVVDAQLMWVPVNAAEVALVWRFQIETLDGNHHFDYTVDAATGKVWTRFDWTASDSYRAYEEPVESASHSNPAQPSDGRVVISNPADPTASPNGWHNDGTTAFLIHRGNNVHAYDDRDANNAPPTTQPACTASRDCNFPLNLANAPSTYTPAALTNLFYWNNIIHDVAYQYGFDEAGGNFQVSNFGRGGAGNDAVRAEGQDGGGTNNANFSTPPDGSAPRMQMFEWTQTNPRRDGDFDNGIIVHEYGHGISTRLVGGPSNSSCLQNSQQGGEGWSDWFALWFTVEPGDVGTDARGIGTYALGQPTTGAGIRTQRYSTNPEINTHTYASIAGKAVPHGVGEVWAQALWEVYWALVDTHGFDPNLNNGLGTAGNQRAMLYVTEGLKNTICSPTFVNARDGIIAAAAASNNGEDVCRLWGAFAAFGLGTDAVSGGPNSTTPTNGFQVPPECSGAEVVFSDDFEQDRGWTANPSGTDTATSGRWERANPETTTSSGTKQQGTTTSGNFNLVTGPLAGSGAGANDVDGGTTTIQSPVIAIPAGGAVTLSLSFYFSHLNNSSSADFFRVQIVGATTATVLEELGSAANDDAAFVKRTVDISSFAGQSVRILISTSDSAGASLVEAAVDDVLIQRQ
ncbi:MAG: extracellular metalloproteinase [Polyangiaceae bacterium]|nr:extracellular metalloproteinase [Polyangiaceae bacterium]